MFNGIIVHKKNTNCFKAMQYSQVTFTIRQSDLDISEYGNPIFGMCNNNSGQACNKITIYRTWLKKDTKKNIYFIN